MEGLETSGSLRSTGHSGCAESNSVGIARDVGAAGFSPLVLLWRWDEYVLIAEPVAKDEMPVCLIPAARRNWYYSPFIGSVGEDLESWQDCVSRARQAKHRD